MRQPTGSVPAALLGRRPTPFGDSRARGLEYRRGPARRTGRTPENEAWRLQLARGVR
jgi:hypothetical protein